MLLHHNDPPLAFHAAAWVRAPSSSSVVASASSSFSRITGRFVLVPQRGKCPARPGEQSNWVISGHDDEGVVASER